ncbi:MAG: GGDEF domain-containing protein [Candidatus Polarisedimenticolaceae bacterium]|nr:GGDEF domain-containing protein [Candidatus Polarisedimenticolaceae bacterium]
MQKRDKKKHNQAASHALTFEFAMEMADRLTLQPDYLSLTEELLAQLHIIPTLQCARVFEVHSATKSVDYSVVSTDDLIVREVVNDLDDLRPFNDIASLSRSIQRMKTGADQELPTSFQQILLPVPGENGQMRVLLIEADYVDVEYWGLIHCLLNIYRNQLLIFDEKERDQLTGLYNRQTFDEKLSRVMSFYQKRAGIAGRNTDHKSWLAILDIDHFKKVNDTFGHLIGDEVLLLFARVMEQSFRHTDMLFRYGGEEFIVILNGTDDEGARVALERFRSCVASYAFPQVGRVTVSTGYVQVEKSYLPISLIEQADKALYYAKDHGRDQVICYDLIAAEDSAKEGDIELF